MRHPHRGDIDGPLPPPEEELSEAPTRGSTAGEGQYEIQRRLARLEEWRRRLLAAVRVQQLLQTLNEFGFTDDDIRQALPKDVSLRSIRRWRTEQVPRTKATARWQELDDLRAIVGYLLSDGTYDEAGIIAWLRSRHRDLRLQRPLDLLREGRFEDVLDAAERALGPMPSDDPIGPPTPTVARITALESDEKCPGLDSNQRPFA